MEITKLIEKLTSLLNEYGDNDIVIEASESGFNINISEIYMDDTSNDYVISVNNNNL